MFCASCECGPAAGPNGVAARWPCTGGDRSSRGALKEALNREIEGGFFCASSRNKRIARTSKRIGASSLIYTSLTQQRDIYSSTLIFLIKQISGPYIFDPRLPRSTPEKITPIAPPVIALAHGAGEARRYLSPKPEYRYAATRGRAHGRLHPRPRSLAARHSRACLRPRPTSRRSRRRGYRWRGLSAAFPRPT